MGPGIRARLLRSCSGAGSSEARFSLDRLAIAWTDQYRERQRPGHGSQPSVARTWSLTLPVLTDCQTGHNRRRTQQPRDD